MKNYLAALLILFFTEPDAQISTCGIPAIPHFV